MRSFLAAILLLTAVTAWSASDTWVPVAEFDHDQGPTAIHARDQVVVAWSGTGVWTSQDAGRSWAGPVAPRAQTAGTTIGIRTARVSADGVVVLGTDASLWTVAGGVLTPLPMQGSALAVDGQGHAWTQAMDGTVRRVPAGATAKGTLYVPVKEGVLIQRGTGLALLTAGGEKPIAFKREDGPIPPSRIAPVATGGGDAWLTKDGHLWRLFPNGKVLEDSERPIEVVVTAWAADGMCELDRFSGRTVIYRPGPGGRQVHIRSQDLPAGVVAFTVAGSALLAVTPTAVFRADY